MFVFFPLSYVLAAQARLLYHSEVISHETQVKVLPSREASHGIFQIFQNNTYSIDHTFLNCVEIQHWKPKKFLKGFSIRISEKFNYIFSLARKMCIALLK